MIQTVSRALAIAVLLLASATAHGQGDASRKKEALALYEQGNQAYGDGQWDRAAQLFADAYQTFPAPAFLFNIGQAKRQGGHCREAIDYYQRFLEAKPDASNRAEVEGFIGGLQICARREAEAAQAQERDEEGGEPPAPEPTADEREVAEAAAAEPEPAEPAEPAAAVVAPAPTADRGPRLVVAHVGAGPAFLGIGELETKTRFTIAGGVGYPIAAGPAVIDVGVHGSYTPLPWESAEGSGTATIATLVANGGVSLPIAGPLSLRAELGAGALFLAAGSESVFVMPDHMATGALTMLHLRAALGLHYALGESLELHAQPVVFGYSPAKTGLRADIEAITGYQLLFGLGYRI